MGPEAKMFENFCAKQTNAIANTTSSDAGVCVGWGGPGTTPGQKSAWERGQRRSHRGPCPAEPVHVCDQRDKDTEAVHGSCALCTREDTEHLDMFTARGMNAKKPAATAGPSPQSGLAKQTRSPRQPLTKATEDMWIDRHVRQRFPCTP